VLDKADVRAKFLYQVSLRDARRVSVAKISTSGLVPAFFEATLVTPIDPDDNNTPDEPTTEGTETGPSNSNSANTHIKSKVKIPIWVSRTVVPADRSPISVGDFERSGSEVWMSVYENRLSGLNIPDGSIARSGQAEEWLAGGYIPKSRIVNVWPFDGEKVRITEGDEVVTSSHNIDWEYDWKHWIWRSRFEMKNIKKALRMEESKKHDASDSNLTDGHDSTKRQKLSDLSSLV